ncbi:hypothetical protein J4212_03065 [Candidatus Woesearchaeota archaeon]|nr:hypothetical protein [Candidatus Woesearchaeota archaeon]
MEQAPPKIYTASEFEIGNALLEWWHYLEVRKGFVPERKEIVSAGIVSDKEGEERTIRLSLAELIAPELDGLGSLVNEPMPHVYVEGIRRPDIIVPMQDAAPSGETNYGFQEHILPFLSQWGLEPNRFYLHIYSGKGHFSQRNIRRCHEAMEILFYNGQDGILRATSMIIKDVSLNPLRKFRRIPHCIRQIFEFDLTSVTTIYPTTGNEMQIAYDSFKRAGDRLKGK